jgi:tRNA G46 methylase TrmB
MLPLNRVPMRAEPHKAKREWRFADAIVRRPAITEGFVMSGFSGRYWIWPEEYAVLAKFVQLTQGNYLEIGSMCGIIAMSLAERHPNRNFLCIDAFVSGHGAIAGEKETFLKNLREHNLKNVTLIEGDDLKTVPTCFRVNSM